MDVFSAVIADDKIKECIDAIATYFGGNRSKAINIALATLFLTEEGRQLVADIEGKKIKIADLINKGREEIRIDELRKYAGKYLNKNFVQNLNNLPYSLKSATFNFIMSVISFIKANGQHPFVGTTKNISIYGNGEHLLYVNISLLPNIVLISKLMHFNRTSHQPEEPYVWNEICRAMEMGVIEDKRYKDKNIPANSIALNEEELIKLHEYFTKRSEELYASKTSL